MSDAARLRDEAMAAEKAGDSPRARQLFESAVKVAPEDPRLLNSAGAAYLRWGDLAQAIALFAKARALAPAELDYPINEAIALGREGRHGAAARLLASVEQIGKSQARYWSARGNAERQAYDFASAQASYDNALAVDPRHARAAHGRAIIAFERGQADTLQRFDRAIALAPGEIALWRTKAMALDAEGRTTEALAIGEQVVTQIPQWVEGLESYAQLRIGTGEKDFASHYDDAVGKTDAPDEIFGSWAKMLAGLDRFAEAADVAARARREAREPESFALSEAVYAGLACDNDRAEAIFTKIGDVPRDWQKHAARQDIRMGRIERAERTLGALIESRDQHDDVDLWALRDVCWRLLDDPRHEWLHGREGLVRPMPLGNPQVLDEARTALRELHRKAALPIGQSVRGGTQTRGRLFQREEPILAKLHDAIMTTLERYRREMPERDESHPILRHRDERWKLTHSWSVRLVGAGYHTSHIHPLGILSSALYLIVPDSVDDDGAPGHLEIGRPPPDLQTALGPIMTIRPSVGHLALFPSSLYHGTRDFDEGERMTVAFDVSIGG
ncbi:2OG-Fe(II) oxygenase family protein [Pseudoblastomonas halimionae]|uniref:Uncharacterized protein n=1 Tax=Alteriqipengyuania halimionae TaxID=1926630 RepID=A0A6I4U7C7_9SPHN|nr:putative 2OG-Fe(II) oxygenase [Alteriqipengyuania halimionae]MXP10783.1 hypothetical protein [Alteriqipengyuania halimionae]